MALPTHGQAGIIVNNADTVRQEGVSVDTGLTNVTRSVGPRIVLQYANTKREERIIAPPADLRTLFAQVPVRIALQYANTKREERITAPPTDLRTLFAQVPARIVLQHANTMRQAALTAPPGELRTLFGQVVNRIILQYANTSRQVTLAYPVALIGDTAPPQISNVVVTRVGASIRVTWNTNEFANSTVLYGMQTGSYPQSVTNPLFERQHEINLTGLRGGTTYFLRVRSADLSGNTATGAERSIVAGGGVYLPYVARRR
ncbi:MAG: fibronectin type III domain-containing protein [Anaerolineae bacterium]